MGVSPNGQHVSNKILTSLGNALAPTPFQSQGHEQVLVVISAKGGVTSFA